MLSDIPVARALKIAMMLILNVSLQSSLQPKGSQSSDGKPVRNWVVFIHLELFLFATRNDIKAISEPYSLRAVANFDFIGDDAHAAS